MSARVNITISDIDTNGDKHISMSELFNFIIREIKRAETLIHLKPEDKHLYVMSVIKTFIGDLFFEKHKVFISGTISFIISSAKNPNMLRGINTVKKFCC